MTPEAAPTPREAHPPSSPAPRIRPQFGLTELAGSLGDMGTFLPLTLAMALSSGMDLGVIFIFAGLMNVLTGLYFAQPIPVQPMKAMAAVAITEGLTPGAIASGGVFIGATVLALAAVGAVDWIGHAVPKPVVRGIQAGVGLKLAWSGLAGCAALPVLGYDSLLVSLIVAAFILLSWRFRWPGLVFIFICGFVLLRLAHPTLYTGFSFTWPNLHLILPTPTECWRGILYAGLPQLPLTLLNSVIAVCALSADYFPGRGIPPGRMALSVGLMNLLCVPLGGMPMCHGAGGLSAQHYFGARTGGSVIMLGGIKIVAGLLLGTLLLGTLQDYPRSILAVMMIIAGLTLSAAARDCLRFPFIPVVIATATPMLVWNTLAGFLCGLAVAIALAIRFPGSRPGHSSEHSRRSAPAP